MNYRIFVDESGTHDDRYLIIGMLFVPQHGALHSDLCRVKEEQGYFNQSPKRAQRYREVHFSKFRSAADITVAKLWVDSFVKHNCFFRSVVIDWSIFDGRFFGDAFDPMALKKRRAYKKWAEMLLQPELSNPSVSEIRNANLYLDRLRIMHGYDVIDHLKDRFSGDYEGANPYIACFQHTDSAKDANQCLQLCDLLTGCLYQSLCPGTKQAKLQVRDYLAQSLAVFGVREFRPEFWKGYARSTLRQHFPKYSAWFWKPTEEGKKIRRQKKQR